MFDIWVLNDSGSIAFLLAIESRNLTFLSEEQQNLTILFYYLTDKISSHN